MRDLRNYIGGSLSVTLASSGSTTMSRPPDPISAEYHCPILLMWMPQSLQLDLLSRHGAL